MLTVAAENPCRQYTYIAPGLSKALNRALGKPFNKVNPAPYSFNCLCRGWQAIIFSCANYTLKRAWRIEFTEIGEY